MTADLLGQAITFSLVAAMGFALGIFYDIFRVFRKMLRHNAVFIAIEDVIFWLLATGLLFVLLLWINFGQIRAFVFIAAALGILIYFSTLSKLLMLAAARLINLVKRGLRRAQKYVMMKLPKKQNEKA